MRGKLLFSNTAQKGQALVEYILLLVVAVAMGMAILNTFFKPFQKYADFMLGEYVQCLLDYGELPGTAVGPDTKNSGVNTCANQALAAGFNPSGDANANNGASSNNSKNNAADSNSTNADKNGAGNNGSRGKIGNNSRNSTSSRGGRGGRGGSGSETGPVGSDIGGGANGSKQFTKLRNRPDDLNRGKSSSANNASDLREKSFTVRGLSGSLIQEQKSKTIVESPNGPLQTESNTALKAKKFSQKLSPPKATTSNDDNSAFSFGGIFRIMIILIIIAAIIYVVATQVNGVVKGMEK
jgi:hypothetical protein